MHKSGRYKKNQLPHTNTTTTNKQTALPLHLSALAHAHFLFPPPSQLPSPSLLSPSLLSSSVATLAGLAKSFLALCHFNQFFSHSTFCFSHTYTHISTENLVSNLIFPLLPRQGCSCEFACLLACLFVLLLGYFWFAFAHHRRPALLPILLPLPLLAHVLAHFFSRASTQNSINNDRSLVSPVRYNNTLLFLCCSCAVFLFDKAALSFSLPCPPPLSSSSLVCFGVTHR